MKRLIIVLAISLAAFFGVRTIAKEKVLFAEPISSLEALDAAAQLYSQAGHSPYGGCHRGYETDVDLNQPASLPNHHDAEDGAQDLSTGNNNDDDALDEEDPYSYDAYSCDDYGYDDCGYGYGSAPVREEPAPQRTAKLDDREENASTAAENPYAYENNPYGDYGELEYGYQGQTGGSKDYSQDDDYAYEDDYDYESEYGYDEHGDYGYGNYEESYGPTNDEDLVTESESGRSKERLAEGYPEENSQQYGYDEYGYEDEYGYGEEYGAGTDIQSPQPTDSSAPESPTYGTYPYDDYDEFGYEAYDSYDDDGYGDDAYRGNMADDSYDQSLFGEYEAIALDRSAGELPDGGVLFHDDYPYDTYGQHTESINTSNAEPVDFRLDRDAILPDTSSLFQRLLKQIVQTQRLAVPQHWATNLVQELHSTLDEILPAAGESFATESDEYDYLYEYDMLGSYAPPSARPAPLEPSPVAGREVLLEMADGLDRAGATLQGISRQLLILADDPAIEYASPDAWPRVLWQSRTRKGVGRR